MEGTEYPVSVLFGRRVRGLMVMYLRGARAVSFRSRNEYMSIVMSSSSCVSQHCLGVRLRWIVSSRIVPACWRPWTRSHIQCTPLSCRSRANHHVYRPRDSNLHTRIPIIHLDHYSLCSTTEAAMNTSIAVFSQG
jgi:hypothetical protein